MADNSSTPPEANGGASDTDVRDAALALAAVLRQLPPVIEAMNDEQYGRKSVGHVEGSAGGHVRHCLDHVSALLGGLSTGCIDYESRERGTDIETDRAAALTTIERFAKRVSQLDDDDMAQAVRVIVRFTANDPTVAVGSTLGREMAFVLSHTIHHNALISAIATSLGVALPEYFGYAPSSIAFLKQS